ncbi:hypothetical protein [Solicola sp. PLA-1-18]|uniref:hypothetical protein n=1 Tax=Solicola sp. PLA-1-18 TaxID=3380532 RepID=UPI003B7723E7
MIRPSTDLTPAAWVAEAGRTEPWQRLVSTGPAGYEAYARLRFTDDEDPRHDEPGALYRACATLAAFTTTPDDLHVALWEGWGLDLVAPRFHVRPPGEVAMRSYWLFTAAVSDLPAWPHEPPAMVWPDDRAWFVAFDVDPPDAGIGGSREAVDALLADRLVDVVAA